MRYHRRRWRDTFASVLAAANESKTGRNPDQWTPVAVETWRAAEPEMAPLLDAAFALELKLDRKVTAVDEDMVRENRAQMDATTAANALPGRAQRYIRSNITIITNR